MPLSRTCLPIPRRRALSPLGIPRWAAICLCTAWVAAQARAETGTGQAVQPERTLQDTVELAPTQVQRPAPPPTSASRAVIVPTDVDRQLGNLADLLQRAAGLHVVRAGGMGDYVGVSVWGSSEYQVNVYVNGVLRNQANDPSLFLSDWDLSRVERIEVYKGMAPDDLPGSPMGGSINIITRDGTGTGLRGAAGAGSFGSLRANGSMEYRTRDWQGRFEAARNQSEGDFPYYDDNGTEFAPGRHPDGAPRLSADDLTRKTRRNNAHAFSELAGDLAFHPTPALEAGAQLDLSRLHKQIPAPGPDVDTGVTVSAFRESDRAALRGYGKWSGADAEASLDVTASFIADAYVDTSKGGGEVGIGYDNDMNRYTDLMATLWGRSKPAPGFTLAALISYGIAGYGYTDRLAGRGYPGIFRYTGEGKLTPAYAFGRHSVQAILAANLALEEQYGRQAYAYGGAPVPGEKRSDHRSLRLAYQYKPRDGIWFTLQAGDAYREPTFMERFGDRGTVLANPSLRPEGGANGSAGAHAERKGWSADLQAFATEGRRIITLEQNSQFVLTYRNTGATRITGLEFRGSAWTRPWTRTDLDVTLMKAQAVSGAAGGDYKLIPYRPASQASLRQTLSYRAWTLAGTGYWQGLAYPNPSNRASLFDSYSHNTEWQARCDLDLSWRIRHLLVAAGAHNLFDQRNFDFFNFPLPGRNYAATVQAEY